MKTTLSTLLFLCLSFFSIAQKINSSTHAEVQILVTDFKEAPKQGETILFENQKDNSVLQGITNESGKFTIGLPYKSSFLIKIKGVGDDTDYTQLDVPALQPNETGLSFQMQIKFEPAQSFTLDNVHFLSGKADLTKSSFSELDELFEFLKLKPNTKIEIAGHTDNIGDESLNLNLSKARAKSVKNYLVNKGISSSRILAKGYGEREPIADNSSEQGRALNRRTEVRVLSE